MEEVKNIQLLVATGLYPPEIGGPATYCKMLEENLPAHNFVLTIIPFSSVRHLPKVLRHIVFFWRLLRASKGKDAIFALDPVSVGLPSLLVCKILRKPFLLRVAGDYAWEQGQLRFKVTDRLEVFYKKRFSYGIRVSMLSYIESFVTRRAKMVIIPSAYWEKVLAHWGVTQSKVHVVYSGLLPLPSVSSKESARAELGYTGIVLVSAGRLVPNKGFIKLLNVFAELAEIRPATTLVIVGDGPQENELKNHVTSLGLDTKVTFTGKLDKTALGTVIKASDIFVLNTDHEGFSHQLLEVMDIGTPVVTTKVGGNPELVVHQESGLLVPYDDMTELKTALLTLIDSPSLREKFKVQGKLRTQLFDEKTLVSKTAEHLKNAILYE